VVVPVLLTVELHRLRAPGEDVVHHMNTRTPSSFGIGASHGEACKAMSTSESPCFHRAAIVERLNSKSLNAPNGSIGR